MERAPTLITHNGASGRSPRSAPSVIALGVESAALFSTGLHKVMALCPVGVTVTAPAQPCHRERL